MNDEFVLCLYFLPVIRHACLTTPATPVEYPSVSMEISIILSAIASPTHASINVREAGHFAHEQKVNGPKPCAPTKRLIWSLVVTDWRARFVLATICRSAPHYWAVQLN
ncbi:hypothetical protein BDW67DRAFT_74116 [Aspergillus spinulosporus]